MHTENNDQKFLRNQIKEEGQEGVGHGMEDLGVDFYYSLCFAYYKSKS